MSEHSPASLGAGTATSQALPGAPVSRPLDWRIGGVLLGLLSTLAVGVQGPLGVSTAYVITEAAIAERVSPGASTSNAYFASVGPALTAEWVLVVGMLLGGLVASLIWRTRVRDGAALPAFWRERFGARRLLRFGAAFAGGFLILFGARLAGGCTSGHSISGMAQLAVSGLVFTAAIFASGIPVALILYSRRKS